MTSERSFLPVLGILLVLGALGPMPAMGGSPTAIAPSRHEDGSRLQRMLAEGVMVLLKEGNVRVASQASTSAPAADGSSPLVTVLSCSDDPIPVERLFGRGIGEVFSVRVGGNVADTDEIATIEYGVSHLQTPLLVVLGHSNCGAVAAVTRGTELEGLLAELLDNIRPAVARARTEGGSEDSVLERAIRENVWQSIADVLRRSAQVRELARQGAVEIQGAVYDRTSGQVNWLGRHPAQDALLEAPSVDEAAITTIPSPEVPTSKMAEAVDLEMALSQALAAVKARPPLPRPAVTNGVASKVAQRGPSSPVVNSRAAPGMQHP